MTDKKITIDSEKCDFCGTCVAVCASDAIELKESTVIIDEDACILCESCVEICPLGVPEVIS